MFRAYIDAVYSIPAIPCHALGAAAPDCCAVRLQADGRAEQEVVRSALGACVSPHEAGVGCRCGLCAGGRRSDCEGGLWAISGLRLAQRAHLEVHRVGSPYDVVRGVQRRVQHKLIQVLLVGCRRGRRAEVGIIQRIVVVPHDDKDLHRAACHAEAGRLPFDTVPPGVAAERRVTGEGRRGSGADGGRGRGAQRRSIAAASQAGIRSVRWEGVTVGTGL
mmetsp:Transcript_32790/g.82595  ORF Transcript_32790/g.82595 Transcript_32790/m.82595 type:complete len:219 (+) Transcript_32790:1403-2059(+)